MNTVDTTAIYNEVDNLVRLLKTNNELFEGGSISKKHYNRNKKLINDRIATLVDTFGKAML